jgi:hypothetical protein
MNTNENPFDPSEYDALPEHLIATPEEELMMYKNTEEVVNVATDFLNIDGAEFGDQLYEALREGHLDPIRTLLILKKMSHVNDYFLGSDASRTNKKAKEYLRDKISGIIGKETYRAYGASINIQAIGGATTMDYSECGDLYLNRLYELQKELTVLVKEQEAKIKLNLPPESKTLGIRTEKVTIDALPVIRFEALNEPTTYNVIPPIKYSREGIVVRFAKKQK